MILEVAVLYVKMGEGEKFEQDFAYAGQLISSAKGYISHSLRKSIEQRNKYLLLVNWNRLEDHIIGFQESELYVEWKRILHHYYDPFPVVEHFETILENNLQD